MNSNAACVRLILSVWDRGRFGYPFDPRAGRSLLCSFKISEKVCLSGLDSRCWTDTLIGLRLLRAGEARLSCERK
jgi:hypothetical protein